MPLPSTCSTTPVAAPPAVQLRPARPTDALCLSVLAMQVYLDTYATQGIRPAIARDVLASFSVQAFDTALADPQARLVVAECAQHLVAYAHVTLGARAPLAPASAPTDAPTDAPAELLRLYVQEPFTGRQVGTALLHEAERLALAAGARLLWLTPWVHNHRAIAFYQRRGYQDQGQTWHHAEGEAHENRLMARRLDKA